MTQRLDINEARLLPHLRAQPVNLIVQPDNGTTRIPTFNAPGQPRTRKTDKLIGEPADLRGIPVIARGVGGTSPGTDPETATIRRHGEWAA
jgi:hypothetical protein